MIEEGIAENLEEEAVVSEKRGTLRGEERELLNQLGYKKRGGFEGGDDGRRRGGDHFTKSTGVRGKGREYKGEFKVELAQGPLSRVWARPMW